MSRRLPSLFVLSLAASSFAIACSKPTVNPALAPANAPAPSGQGAAADEPASTVAVLVTAAAGTATAVTTPDDKPTVEARNGVVLGKVFDSSGAPVASAAVAVTAATAPHPDMAAFTFADGTFQWLLAPGTYTLEANRDGYAPASGEVTVEAGKEVTLELVMEALP